MGERETGGRGDGTIPRLVALSPRLPVPFALIFGAGSLNPRTISNSGLNC